MLNLDTHILVQALTGDVTPKERRLLESQSWGVAAIVLWELCKLAEKGRLEIDLDDELVEERIKSLHVWPITFEISRASTRLDFKSDPADELIAATSVVHQIPLLTRDKTIRRSKMVPLAK